jgi:hypothetical protein
VRRLLIEVHRARAKNKNAVLMNLRSKKYSKLRKLQGQVNNSLGRSEPLAFVSQLDNAFSVLDPRETIAMVSGCA